MISERYVGDTADDTTPTPQPPISLRAYAKHRAAAGLPGCSPEAVSKAVKSGRLRDSVVLVDGEPKIADPELADREWAERSAPRILQPSPPPPQLALGFGSRGPGHRVPICSSRSAAVVYVSQTGGSGS